MPKFQNVDCNKCDTHIEFPLDLLVSGESFFVNFIADYDRQDDVVSWREVIVKDFVQVPTYKMSKAAIADAKREAQRILKYEDNKNIKKDQLVCVHRNGEVGLAMLSIRKVKVVKDKA